MRYIYVLLNTSSMPIGKQLGSSDLCGLWREAILIPTIEYLHIINIWFGELNIFWGYEQSM